MFLIVATSAELITAKVDTTIGVIFYMVLLSSLIIVSIIAYNRPYHKLYLALTLLPLIRLVSLSMPLSQFTQVYWYFLTSIPIFLAIIAIAVALNYRPADINLKTGNIFTQSVIAITGFAFGLVLYNILKPDSLIDHLTLSELLIPALIFLVSTGFVEELAFRGVLQHTSESAIGPYGWVYVAFLSSIMYISYLSLWHWITVFLAGLFFGWAVQKTRSLLGVSVAHGIINICVYLVIPLLNQ